jgi:CAAX protease family protein
MAALQSRHRIDRLDAALGDQEDGAGHTMTPSGTDAPESRVPPVKSARILLLAFVGEGTLLVAGLLWMLWREIPLAWGEPVRATAAGLLCACGLAAVQYALLRLAPPIRFVEALRRLYRDLLFPLFRDRTPLEIALISVLAGVGEEVFFRGAMQPEWGLVIASVLFGACHVGSRLTIVLGVWAASTGALLGWLRIATGGLLAPIIAHIAYDALALAYLRWGPVPDTPARGAGPVDDTGRAD